MADLDDFFAKKDKKKSRGAVKKFTASELMTSAPVLKAPVVTTHEESSNKKPEIVQSFDPVVTVEAPTVAKPRAPTEPEDEEWGEFEQEKEKDYSGLKIQKLQIQDSDAEEEDEDGDHELNEEGVLVKRELAGPWNKINTQQGPVQPQGKSKEQAVEALPNTSCGRYIPPIIRNKTAGGTGSGSTARTRTGKKDKGAPDLNNEEFFPTLSAAVAIEQNNFKLKKFEQTERGFTEAKPSRSHSNRMAPGPGEDGPRLNLGNKFNALSNDE